jgi:hypothetical protein
MADMAAAWTACTKKLFCRKKMGPRGEATCPGVLLFLLAFLKGGLEKAAASGWFFVVILWWKCGGDVVFGWCVFVAENFPLLENFSVENGPR